MMSFHNETLTQMMDTTAQLKKKKNTQRSLHKGEEGGRKKEE